MQKYFDDVFYIDEDSNPVPLEGAAVTVYEAGTTTVVSLFSDNISTLMSNPFVSGENGTIEFYAADGRYDILVQQSPYKTRLIEDILIDEGAVNTSANISSLSSAVSQLSIDDSENLSIALSASDSAALQIAGASESFVNSCDTSVITQLSAADSTNLSTEDSAIASSVSKAESADTSIITQLSTVDSTNLSTENSANSSVIAQLSTVDSSNLSVSESYSVSAATSIHIANSHFPFYNDLGVEDPIELTTNMELPFYDNLGAANNIALTT